MADFFTLFLIAGTVGGAFGVLWGILNSSDSEDSNKNDRIIETSKIQEERIMHNASALPESLKSEYEKKWDHEIEKEFHKEESKMPLMGNSSRSNEEEDKRILLKTNMKSTSCSHDFVKLIFKKNNFECDYLVCTKCQSVLCGVEVFEDDIDEV